MRSLIFASAVLVACAVSNVHAQNFPGPQGGQTIVETSGNGFGGTTYVFQNADGTYQIVMTGPRGGVRRVFHRDTLEPKDDPNNGYTYALDGGPLTYKAYEPDRRPMNVVDPNSPYINIPSHRSGGGG